MRIKINAANFPQTSYSETSAKQGDAVYAVGFPAAADILSDTEAHTSQDATITDGIVSARREVTTTLYGTPVEILQISAAINSVTLISPLLISEKWVAPREKQLSFNSGMFFTRPTVVIAKEPKFEENSNG